MRLNNLSRHLKTFVAVGALLFAGRAYATNWYVRPSSAGSNTGTDWNNAWSLSSLNWANVKPGDTVWLSGGSYSGGLNVGASGSSGNPILINRVLSTDSVPASAAGWSSSFDSTVALSNAISFSSCSYVTLDGRKPFIATAGSQGVSNAGITVTIPLSGGDGIDGANAGPISNIVVRNVSLIGPYASTSNPAGGGGISGINICYSNNAVTNCTFHGISIVGTGEAVRAAAWNGVIIEYCYIADTNNDGQQHEDIQYSYPSVNCIWRYNQINNSPNDGVFFEFGGATNFYFYGNVYYDSGGWFICTKAASGSVYGPVFIYNNVFMAASLSAGPGGSWMSDNGASLTGTSYVENNIFYNVSNDWSGSSGVVSDYNAYYGVGQPGGEAHSFTFSGNPFVLIPANSEPVGSIGNFRLTAAMRSQFQNGIGLLADGLLNKDIDGNTRGSGGAWSIGAFQYASSSQPNPTPLAPTGLRITGSP